MSDDYQNWVDRVVEGHDAKPLSPNEVIKSSAGEPFEVVKFARISKANFTVDLGKKGKYYIYHFYPSARFMTGTEFEDALSDVFLELFKREDQVEVDWVEEMKSWYVRVSGWTDHVWGDDLAERVIHRLDQVLTEGHV